MEPHPVNLVSDTHRPGGVVQHDTGKNAAYYMKGYYKRALEFMKVKNLEVKSTNDTLWIEFST
jgi:hypothetical protein